MEHCTCLTEKWSHNLPGGELFTVPRSSVLFWWRNGTMELFTCLMKELVLELLSYTCLVEELE
jgi:hypothetical protein